MEKSVRLLYNPSVNLQPSTINLQLEKLTYGGDAMGRLPDGRAVFIPFGLQGERVRIRLTEQKQNFARGELLEILEPSPNRIVAKCKHFGICGGCHYQNLSCENQLLAKAEILRDQLLRIGKIENPPVAPMVASSSEWNYRNHVQFHLTEDDKIGFVNAAGNTVIPISECHLPESSINSLWPQLEFEADLDISRVSLRAGADDDLMLVLESDSPEAPGLEIEADISVVHLFEDHPVVVAGADHHFIRVFGRDFKVSAPSFFQVNTAMAETMVEHLLASLPITPNDTLLDLYCGVGLFSAFFASRAGGVIGVESSESACEDFAFNLDEFDNVELYEGAAEEILPALVAQIGKMDYAIVDPPRAGLAPRVVDAMQALGPRVIAYVSCDPSTLARDAKRLITGGYRLVQVTPFDLFPQTYHIESISIFEKP
ncbi:MAG: class I SAM-dependent RNA methyltransferase [Anaerolineaceae bacterium]|nr:MAG: class I SAM-dependent RNA methyltransferase [Anaerolineaceae bacterium]